MSTPPPPQGVMAEPELTRLHYESGKLDAEFATDAAKYLAESFRDLCDKHGAQNYLQMKMHDPEGREFVVTVQRGGHPTAHDLRRQAEAQNTALLARCEGLEGERDALARALSFIRDSTFRNATSLRALADDAVNRYKAGDFAATRTTGDNLNG